MRTRTGLDIILYARQVETGLFMLALRGKLLQSSSGRRPDRDAVEPAECGLVALITRRTCFYLGSAEVNLTDYEQSS